MKKKYIKPTIIDLSIEGMTGFGYGVMSADCQGGHNFASATCGSGIGFNSSCTEGSAPTNDCSTGNFPTDGGTICGHGLSANGRMCTGGSAVSGFNPECQTGGGGFDPKHDSADCEGGSTANYCYFGNSNVGGFS